MKTKVKPMNPHSNLDRQQTYSKGYLPEDVKRYKNNHRQPDSIIRISADTSSIRHLHCYKRITLIETLSNKFAKDIM
jgi:hypothetical protein